MTSDKRGRIEPLMPPDWTGDRLEALGAFPRGLQFVLDQWNSDDGDPRGLNVLGCFARHPALAKAYLTFNNHVATGTNVSARERELLILRIGWLRQCEYEFLQHVILGLRAGLTEEEVRRVQDGPDAPGWDANDADLVRVADELHENAAISADTWARLATRYDEQQMMDMIFVVGCYDVIAMMMKSLDIPMEPGVEPLDPEILERMYAQ